MTKCAGIHKDGSACVYQAKLPSKFCLKHAETEPEFMNSDSDDETPSDKQSINDSTEKPNIKFETVIGPISKKVMLVKEVFDVKRIVLKGDELVFEL